jgi:hypothetical protein
MFMMIIRWLPLLLIELFTMHTYIWNCHIPLSVQTYEKWDTRVVWLKVAYSFGKYERPSLKEDAIPSGKGG